jgi:release factor glutamine methyltransferase
MTIKKLTTDITQQLQPLYDEREAAAVAYLYVQTKLGMQRYELALRGMEELTESQISDIEQDVEKLKSGCPVQYVLGETEFYGLMFQVSPAVLIPRPETEELVQMIVQQFKNQKVNIWDIGTGSGCIAISLAKMLPLAKVFATDISEDALQVARQNAERNGVGVTFACHDMADVEHLPFGDTQFDVIVSNPPYIPTSDRANMHTNVVDYEPETALFVPDDDKLWCYRAIAHLAQRSLAPHGQIFMETYHDFHEELTAMYHHIGFKKVHSIKDLNEKLRFIQASAD